MATLKSLPSPLSCVSFDKLLSNDHHELQVLLNACQTVGCFYMNVSGIIGPHDEIRDIIEGADAFFKSPLPYKSKWEMDTWGNLHMAGYKPMGKHTGAAKGKRDAFENFLVPFDYLCGDSDGLTSPSLPPTLEAVRGPLTSLHLKANKIAMDLLSVLTRHINTTRTPNGRLHSELRDLHKSDAPSTTTMGILRYPPVPREESSLFGHQAHTDVGSLTLLYTTAPGLQVFDPSSDQWLPVDPVDCHVIVNVGDTLSFMTGGLLKACVHRVISHTVDEELHSAPARWSLAFFKRPELEARFEDLQGNPWTGQDWHMTKYKIFREDNSVQGQSGLLTGIEGFLGLTG